MGKGNRHVQWIADNVNRADGRVRWNQRPAAGKLRVRVVNLQKNSLRRIFRDITVNARAKVRDLLRGQIGRFDSRRVVEHPSSVCGHALKVVNIDWLASVTPQVLEKRPEPGVTRLGV